MACLSVAIATPPRTFASVSSYGLKSNPAACLCCVSVCRRGQCFTLSCGGGPLCFMCREMEGLKKAIGTSPDVALGHLKPPPRWDVFQLHYLGGGKRSRKELKEKRWWRNGCSGWAVHLFIINKLDYSTIALFAINISWGTSWHHLFIHSFHLLTIFSYIWAVN